MNILIVVGTCLRQNTSANLCHICYINGLLELGHSVDLVSVDEKDWTIDKGIVFPKVTNSYTYYGLSLYEKLSIKKNKVVSENNSTEDGTTIASNKSLKQILFSVVDKVKKIWWYSYGPYCTNKVWSNRASKFKSDKKYDYVISLAFPAASHRAVKKMIDKKNINYDKWIQIWEDPWSSDLLYYNGKFKMVENAERKIIQYADKIVYVSPLTLENQKRLFPTSAHKMTWFPLPSYYSSVNKNIDLLGKKTYGYFGDYASHIRNLVPFYECAVKKNLELNICGFSDLSLTNNDKVTVYPRLKLDELKPLEDKTNVLVFVCNLRGGQIPGKIYQYAATNKIVLFILDGTEEEKKVLKDFFGKFNRFIFCENNDKSICEAIEQIENNNFANIVNEPLSCFKATDTIQSILDSVKD